MNWKFFATMAAGMLESAGMAKEAEDDNDTGADDILGEGLVYAAQLIKWLIGGMKGNAPTAPKGI